ncbi:MAG: hypothetical protein EXR74_00055 [Bdellovibrionales bacterium]|nr:hypothetical protein [Bdellovibrionales bacterium]
MVEWLMLIVASFTTAYFIITGPFADFTVGFLRKIQTYTQSIVLKGESETKASEPSDPKRFKPVHL